MSGGGKFDFLVTESVDVTCVSRHERSLKVSVDGNDGLSGKVTYYPRFLWVRDSTKTVTKTLDFKFSQDAKNDGQCFADFEFADTSGESVGSDVMQVFADGQKLKDNVFRVTSNETSKKLTFRFAPGSGEGRHQGFLKLTSHSLDRLDNHILSSGEQMDEAFAWTLDYEQTMNPLKKALWWLAGTTIGILLFWRIMLRPLFYPKFGAFRKTVIIRRGGQPVSQFSRSFKGVRKVVFYKEKVRQSGWNRFFTGEIKTCVDPNISTPLEFTPKGKASARARGRGYTARPAVIPKTGRATIDNQGANLQIELF